MRHNSAYCSVCCGGKVPYSRLDIVKPGQRQYRIFDSLPKQLESDLKLECDLIMTERPNMCFGCAVFVL